MGKKLVWQFEVAYQDAWGTTWLDCRVRIGRRNYDWHIGQAAKKRLGLL